MISKNMVSKRQRQISVLNIKIKDHRKPVRTAIWLAAGILLVLAGVTSNAFAQCDCTQTSITGVPQIECEALVAFYNSTNGPGWKRNAGWDTASNCDTWQGVTVTAGSVSSITFAFNDLAGAIPPELGNLENLRCLRLYNNALEGEIPPSLTNLINLIATDLGYNELTASDAGLIAFLNTEDPDWADTQTIPPNNLGTTDIASTSIRTMWR